MNATRKAQLDRFAVELVRMSTSRLIDDTRVRLVVPLRAAATATIAECLAAKAVAA